MQRMTIGGAFGAMFDFIRTSWLVIIGSMLVTVLAAGAAGVALIGGNMAALQSSDPSAAMGIVGSLMLVLLVMVIFYQAGSFISWRHGLTGGSEPILSTVGWAIGASALSLLSMIVIGIIIYIAMIVVVLILVAIIGVGGGLGSNPFSPDGNLAGAGAGVVIGVIVGYALFIVGFYWIYGRLCAAGPVMAVRRTVNPVVGLSESWRLTGPSQWTIVGFLLLMLVISFVVSLIISFAFGSAVTGMAIGSGFAASPDTAFGMSSIIVLMLVYVPSLVIAVAMPAAIYRQVAGDTVDTVGDVFA